MKYSKREIFYIVIYLLIIFFIGTGLTFSYLNLVNSAEKDSTRIYAGRMDINFIQGQEVSTDILYPISEPSFNQIRNVYRNRFEISTIGTLEQMVSIKFETSLNEFSNNSIKYAIYSGSGNKLADGYINEPKSTLAENLYFTENETREFVLIIWLDNSNQNQNSNQGKILKGTIVVESTQLIY